MQIIPLTVKLICNDIALKQGSFVKKIDVDFVDWSTNGNPESLKFHVVKNFECGNFVVNNKKVFFLVILIDKRKVF